MNSGIPLISDYDRLLGSTFFKEMEKFSNSFLSTNSEVLESYGKKWTRDPLHQWSRQWEYPYCASKISEFLAVAGNSDGRPGIKILDAGSGATFFPHYIVSNIPDTTVECIDQDKSLSDIYAKINADSTARVRFNHGDLHNMSFSDGEFDIIYCISVLEHTDDYHKIIAEFSRILKKNGILIITFDISIDGDADIPVDGAKRLLHAVQSKFSLQDSIQSGSPLDRIYQDNILSTQYINKINRTLLPWKFPRIVALKALKRFRLPKRLLLDLTVCCCIFQA